jgi:hypothetical protein
MGDLESQEEDDPKRILWYKPTGFLGVIRSHHRDESWSVSLWDTFFVTCVGLKKPVLTKYSRFVVAKKFVLDVLDDHVRTCTVHSETKKDHDWTTI